MHKILSLIAVGALAGCSGGGGVQGKAYVPLDGTGTTPLAASSAGATVSLNRDTNELTYNGVVGQINATGDTVAFSDGSTMALSGLDNAYSRLFVLSGDDPDIGAYGVDTANRDIPRGSATYSGESIVVVTAPEGVFDLTGDANVEVSFDGGDASLTLDELTGTRSTGVAAPENVDDFGSVSITEIDLSGGRLSNGNAVVTTSETDAFDGNVSGGVSGALFGPNAEEVGGSADLTGDGAQMDVGFIAQR